MYWRVQPRSFASADWFPSYNERASDLETAVSVIMGCESTTVVYPLSTKVAVTTSTMVVMTTLGDRLKKLRTDRGHTQQYVAALAGVTKQAISKIERIGLVDASGSTLEPIARHYGVNVRWLITGEGPRDRLEDEIALDAGWSDIVGVRQAAALGDGAVPDEYAETHKLKFRADSLRRKKLRAEKLAVIYGKGDSMYPTIKDGDAILIDTSDTTPRDGKLYVITYNGDLLAKRLIELGGRWFINSDNVSDPKWHKPQPLDETKGIEIHGRVRWIGSWED